MESDIPRMNLWSVLMRYDTSEESERSSRSFKTATFQTLVGGKNMQQNFKSWMLEEREGERDRG